MSANELVEKARSLRELIESEAEAIEQKCTLTDPVVQAIEETGLFRLITPKELGGLESDVETVRAVCEEVSYADGAVESASIDAGSCAVVEAPKASTMLAAKLIRNRFVTITLLRTYMSQLLPQ